MTGIFFGIGAAFFWSINNIIDKHLTNKHASDGNVWAVVILSSLFPASLLPIAYSLGDVTTFDYQSLILMFCGTLMVGWLYFYLKSLTEADTSVVMTMLVLAPFFALLFSFAFLGERLTLLQMLGGALLITSSLVISYDRDSKGFNTKLLIYALCASIITGLMYSLFKLQTDGPEFWTSMFWRSLGMVTTGMLLCVFFKSINSRFYIYLTQHLKNGIVVSTTNESLTVSGDLFFSFAILLAPVALVQTTEAYQPVFIIVMSLILSKLGFSSFRNEVEDSLGRKLFAIGLAILGSTIVVLNS